MKETDEEFIELIDKKEWIELGDKQGNTALHYAVFRNCIAAVDVLERHGADISKTNANGLNCMHLAAQGGSPALIVKQYRYSIDSKQKDSIQSQSIAQGIPLSIGPYTQGWSTQFQPSSLSSPIRTLKNALETLPYIWPQHLAGRVLSVSSSWLDAATPFAIAKINFHSI